MVRHLHVFPTKIMNSLKIMIVLLTYSCPPANV